MAIFRRNKQEQSKIDVEIIKRVANLEARYEILEQLIKNLRGLVNKKIGNDIEPTEKHKYSDPFDNVRIGL